ncbi:N-acetyl-glucosamine-6-phosphate deacetylase [Basidiobolus ranarum]|uniref:N-acetylglucosamine-6-phosphate deacetylase n=1 Tax=Basidiobolus ranarum TaxID=34480 RepID=A0ABR2W588_9FUNG
MSKEATNRILKIINGRIIRDGNIITGENLYVKDGKFVDGKSYFWDHTQFEEEVIDAEDSLVSPGFLDIQINGALGVDFTADRENLGEKLEQVAKGLLKWGCTSFCPTIVSSQPEVYAELMHVFARRDASVEHGAGILGAHLEGPFISPLKFGAHEVKTLRTAPNGVTDLLDCYNIKEGKPTDIAIITVAPEVEGVMNAIPELANKGVVVSIGHSVATTDQAEEAISKGATLVTHMFNALHEFHHRDPGIIGTLGSSRKRPYYGLICDGIHSHPNSVKIAYDAHPEGVVLVTDAMSAAGLPPGKYYLGAMEVDKSSDRAYITGTTTLAGSVVTIDDCVKNFRKFTGCTIVEAVEAATLHPAKVLGITHKKGTFNVGADADVLFLDDDLNIKRVFVSGDEVSL